MPKKKILVLGAYGLVGAEIVKGLLEKTDTYVTALGRNPEKLNTLQSSNNSTRLKIEVMDAYNYGSIGYLYENHDCIINCVGPYALQDGKLAEIAITKGKPYIDFANEQVHYKKLSALHDSAKKKGVFLVTAAGLVPGFSTLLMRLASEQINGIDTYETYYIERRRNDPETGINSIMSGILETGFGNSILRDGKLEPFKMGSLHKHESIPGSKDSIYLFAVPGADTLMIQKILKVKNITSWFSIDEPPPGYLFLIRLLKPHKNKRIFEVMKKMVIYLSKKEHINALLKGTSTGCILKVIGYNNHEKIEYQFTTEDSGKGTAYFPIIIAKLWNENKFPYTGVVDPSVFFDPNIIFREMDRLKFPYELKHYKNTP